ncbi:hypothetical protein M378DRAFT_164529 [Amanita muscaria Koide BX008]|uniref:Uncharacterized protein n=1 Tax=Amanita muscaria (strain Koide BX008) TaxID=946122 RepID=A0A0C2T9V0_AMAMK|nr:hypothetical protein M378DRAFT_164529 [Amanita muscaria Koide BX008]
MVVQIHTRDKNDSELGLVKKPAHHVCSDTVAITPIRAFSGTFVQYDHAVDGTTSSRPILTVQ